MIGVRISPREAEVLRPWFPGLDVAQVRVVVGGPVCWLVRAVLQKSAMTVGPFVFLGSRRRDPDDPDFLALLAHEIKHVEQFRRYGYVGFLLKYWWDLARHGFRYSQKLPLEAEAYELERRFRSWLAAKGPSSGGGWV
jgi:hypothetical protein